MNQAMITTESLTDKPSMKSLDEFIRGQRDCKKGIEPQSQSQGYITGYSFQYEVEARQSAKGFN